MVIHMKHSEKIQRLNLDVDLESNDSPSALLSHLKNTGCAVLKNHKIPVHLLNEMLCHWNEYFSDNRKFNWLRREETDEGFIPLNVEMAKNGETPDFKELYQAHYNRPLPNIFDTSITIAMFTDLVMLGKRLCELLDMALPTEIRKKMSMSLAQMIDGSNNHLLRVIHYPPITNGVHIQRALIHTDICLLTIVFGAAFDGLELQNPMGELFVPIISDDVIVVFNSDMLDKATGGYLQATPHQVKANSNHQTTSRYSVISAIHPKRGVDLWEGETAGEYLRHRLNSMGYKGNLLNLQDN